MLSYMSHLASSLCHFASHRIVLLVNVKKFAGWTGNNNNSSSSSSSSTKSSAPEQPASIPHFLEMTSKDSIAANFCRIKAMEDDRIHDAVVRRERSPWSMQHGVQAFDLKRNRYSNILPFDYNRVKLDVAKGYCDYINASHVDVDVDVDLGPKESYIATQGPTKITTPHFWNMLLQQSEHPDVVVIMVTPLKEGTVTKCSKYWIDTVGQVMTIPQDEGFAYDIRLECLSHEHHDHIGGAYYTKIQLDALDSEGTVQHKRTVHHLYFDQWTDTLRPDAWEPIMRLSQLARSLNGEGNPLVVHCSAGVGRTGTFITMDYLLSHPQLAWDREDEDLVLAIVQRLREQRITMVQSCEQFRFCYEMLTSFMTMNDE